MNTSQALKTTPYANCYRDLFLLSPLYSAEHSILANEFLEARFRLWKKKHPNFDLLPRNFDLLT